MRLIYQLFIYLHNEQDHSSNKCKASNWMAIFAEFSNYLRLILLHISITSYAAVPFLNMIPYMKIYIRIFIGLLFPMEEKAF